MTQVEARLAALESWCAELRRSQRDRVGAGVKVNAYAVIADAVERGIQVGWHRAWKHRDALNRDEVPGALEQAVLNELCQVLTFDETEVKP